MNNNFILSIDGSSISRKAENYFKKIYNPERDMVTVLFVIETQPLGSSDNNKDSNNHAGGEDQLSQEGELILNETEDRLDEAGFKVNTKIRNGNAGEEICQLAHREEADGIILGRTGRSRLEEVLLGSVSDYVIRHADCPVTTVPDS